MPRPFLVLLVVLFSTLGAACSGASSGTVSTGDADAAVTSLGLQIVERIPHATDAFTQGFVLDQGRLFESTGLVGKSTLREIDPSNGEVLRQRAADRDVFAEGLALVDDRLVQLTWLAGKATVFDQDTFEPVGEFSYEGEGWGLCHDGTMLVMSNGTSTLTMRDPNSFAVINTVQVTRNGAAVERINELECVDGVVWANVWQTTDIIRIDPVTGVVTGVVDASGLYSSTDANAVLNGIAYDDQSGEFLITGKLWPEMFRVRFTD